MVIRKDGKEYSVTELAEYWVILRRIGELSVEYKVPKDICADEAALRKYVKTEEIF